MTKYPHNIDSLALCEAIDAYREQEDVLPEAGMIAAFEILLAAMDKASAALTAQPIELPRRYSCEGYHIDEAYLVADEDGDCFDREEVIEKLRQQGYEVQE